MLADFRAPSYSPTHMSRVLHDEDCKDEDDDYQIVFPLYDNEKDYGQVKDVESQSNNINSHIVLPILKSTSAITSSLPLPDPFDRAEDDTAIGVQPSRHVDYLLHIWKEEDIWSSWKYIVSKRKVYGNNARLENALWRTWMKSKNKLNTVSPETINWSKDCDVIWLYGPLQTGTDMSLHQSSSWIASSRISKPNTCLNKKPILKKRSMSEIMLQRSFSSLSLRRHAAATAQAQQFDNRGFVCLRTDHRVSNDTVSFSPPGFSQENASMLSSISSLGSLSPEVGEKKTIRFNEQVEQCISLEIKGSGSKEIYAINDHDDSDSGDEGIVMRSNTKRKLTPLLKRRTSGQTSSMESKTIAMLPPTTLKYKGDTLEAPGIAMKHSNGFWSGSKSSHSPFQETSRPSTLSTRMLFGSGDEGNDDGNDDVDMDWQPPSTFINRKDCVSVAQERLQNLYAPASTSSLTGESSAFSMRYEEVKDDVMSESFVGKIMETVNTARDIAQAITAWSR